MPTFPRALGADRLQLHYSERGDPDGPPIVLMHGLLLSSRTMEGIAARLPDHRVLLLDLHGHGKSDKPTSQAAYTWAALAGDAVALLDHLGLERAVVGGLSLGANVTLTLAQSHPDRVAAMIVEMPVLSRGERVGRPAFSALAGGYAAGGSALSRAAGLLGRLPLPKGAHFIAGVRDAAGQDPSVAVALLRGLLAEPLVPEDKETLSRLTTPALVIGHRNDPVHVLEDARDLVNNLPNATLVEASSIVEFRLNPERLAGHVRRFLATVSV